MTNIITNIPLTDYVTIKIGPATGRGHSGYHHTLLEVASKVITPDQTNAVKDSIDSIASAVRVQMDKTIVGERGHSGHPYTVEPSELIHAMLKLAPYLGQNLGVEKVIRYIEIDLRYLATK